MGISFNKIILVGRLTRDPEHKFAASGTAITTFSLAVDRDYPKDSNEADFIRIVTFGKTAEFVFQYLTKGRLVLVEGSLRINKWEKDGEKKQNAEVNASRVCFAEISLDDMHGMSIHEQRLCQPYGDDQRQSLDQFRYLEPETWEKVLNRVHGDKGAGQRLKSWLIHESKRAGK